MNKEEVLEKFSRGFDCAAVVLSHFHEELEMDEMALLRLGSPFSGGIGENSICGAVAGALMAIGLKYGHDKENDEVDKVTMIKKRTKFLDEYKKRNGSINCSGILGKDLTKKEDLNFIMENNLLITKCPEAVISAIEILEEIFRDNE